MDAPRPRAPRLAAPSLSLGLLAAFLLAGCGGSGSSVPSSVPSGAARSAQVGLTGNGSPPVHPMCGCGCELDTLSTSNFNGTRIPDGSAIWFNAVAKIKGVTSGTVTFTNQQVTIDGGTPIALPDTTVDVGGTASTHAAYDSGTNTWHVGAGDSGKNVFVGGLLYQVPAGGIAGGQNPVVWSGTFHLPHGASVQWQWAAAVYSPAPSLGMDALDVLAYDGANGGEHAGTPDAIRHSVRGGARGGGGSNFTGSYSGTFSAFCPLP